VENEEEREGRYGENSEEREMRSGRMRKREKELR
jgi:hypothetical protein